MGAIVTGSEMVCVRCGCTESQPCVDQFGGACAWVIEGLCSACVTEEELALMGADNPSLPMSEDENDPIAVDPRAWARPEPKFRKVYT